MTQACHRTPVSSVLHHYWTHYHIVLAAFYLAGEPHFFEQFDGAILHQCFHRSACSHRDSVIEPQASLADCCPWTGQPHQIQDHLILDYSSHYQTRRIEDRVLRQVERMRDAFVAE